MAAIIPGTLGIRPHNSVPSKPKPLDPLERQADVSKARDCEIRHNIRRGSKFYTDVNGNKKRLSSSESKFLEGERLNQYDKLVEDFKTRNRILEETRLNKSFDR